MKTLSPREPQRIDPEHVQPFEITSDHRERPGWAWLMDRLLREPQHLTDTVAADDRDVA
jgi:hypothetical protein